MPASEIPRLTDPLVDILGPDILGINNLFIWKAPKIGLGFPWHQDKFYFRNRFKTETTIGTWTAIDSADRDNGCLYVVPGSHKSDIFEHDDLEGSQQQEFKLARGVSDADGVAVEVPPGAVIWFHSHLLHKSTDNHSLRFRRSYVVHYLSAQAEWSRPAARNNRTRQPVMWIRGETFLRQGPRSRARYFDRYSEIRLTLFWKAGLIQVQNLRRNDSYGI